MYRKIWVYGLPFTGKTTFACNSPKHLVISTDGNAQYSTDSFKVITDEVKKNGRMVQRTMAWEVFEKFIEELEADNPYETIVLDLIEDTYEMCRLFMYNELHITHESDDSFRAWDKIRTRYLSTIRRFMNLPCNIVLVSHEDNTKDIRKPNGENVTAIKPNITDKIANKLAGMSALVGRAVVNDGKYELQIKPNEITFGGGRLGVNAITVPLDWDEVGKLFDKR